MEYRDPFATAQFGAQSKAAAYDMGLRAYMLKIYNYMAMGLPVIAFDRPASREILGETGIYCKFGDSDDLAEKLVWALENPSSLLKFGVATRARAESHLSWAIVAARIEQAYGLASV